MSFISENISSIQENIKNAARSAGRDASEIQLIAVSKTVEVEQVREAMACGQYLFGENRVQELCHKYAALQDEGPTWHLIGHLQTNKVKEVIGKVDLIHSVDSVHLLEKLENEAEKCNKRINFLLQVNVSGEASKFGLAVSEVDAFVERAVTMQHSRLCGLMTIPPRAEKADDSRIFFEKLRNLAVDIEAKNYDNISMRYLSMGMSGDYMAAIAEGANLVRIGTSIFGKRKN